MNFTRFVRFVAYRVMLLFYLAGSIHPAYAQGTSTSISGVPAESLRKPIAFDWARRSAWVEGALLGGTVLSFAGAQFVPQYRGSLGPDSAHAFERTANNNSYATVGFAFGLSTAYYLLVANQIISFGYSNSQSYWMALPTILSDVEAVLIASSVTDVLKSRVGRCRPRAWQDGYCHSNLDENYKAFPSNHTAIPAALAGVHLVLLLSDPSLTNAGFLTGFELATMTTAYLRVKAGAHSWTDVGAGFALGHIAGIAIGMLHPQIAIEKKNYGVSLFPTSIHFDGKSVSIGGAF
jgi:membrane-associated phospholipid phosphatase